MTTDDEYKRRIRELEYLVTFYEVQIDKASILMNDATETMLKGSMEILRLGAENALLKEQINDFIYSICSN